MKVLTGWPILAFASGYTPDQFAAILSAYLTEQPYGRLVGINHKDPSKASNRSQQLIGLFQMQTHTTGEYSCVLRSDILDLFRVQRKELPHFG